MTAPDEPICGPACDPTKCMPGCALQPDHAHKPSEQANEQAALRDRIRDTIHAASPTCPTYHPHECHPCTYRASLVMRHAVRPALDAKDAEIARQTADADRLDQLLIDERATTARLGRELGRLRDQQNGHQT